MQSACIKRTEIEYVSSKAVKKKKNREKKKKHLQGEAIDMDGKQVAKNRG